MSCPPKEFLQNDVLENVRKLLYQNGLFILNLVLRNKTLKPEIVNALQISFKVAKICEVDDDLNEILLCAVNDEGSDVFEKKFNDASASVDMFLEKYNK